MEARHSLPRPGAVRWARRAGERRRSFQADVSESATRALGGPARRRVFGRLSRCMRVRSQTATLVPRSRRVGAGPRTGCRRTQSAASGFSSRPERARSVTWSRTVASVDTAVPLESRTAVSTYDADGDQPRQDPRTSFGEPSRIMLGEQPLAATVLVLDQPGVENAVVEILVPGAQFKGAAQGGLLAQHHRQQTKGGGPAELGEPDGRCRLRPSRCRRTSRGSAW